KPGGRLAVLTYQSLEDRVVKNWIRDHAEEEKRQPGMAFGQPNPQRWVRSLGEAVPSETEVAANPRARSARLRGAERTGEAFR
ncbi:MAG: 16S rRNA (cytosine(1402)-N(4))-methyltransferase, partial [Verrucomicrobia bacterium]|nr:16S rRNA (cytosine(1402)-N(4))-methyltransferase [Verrucomicrobiota bacterium]